MRWIDVRGAFKTFLDSAVREVKAKRSQVLSIFHKILFWFYNHFVYVFAPIDPLNWMIKYNNINMSKLSFNEAGKAGNLHIIFAFISQLGWAKANNLNSDGLRKQHSQLVTRDGSSGVKRALILDEFKPNMTQKNLWKNDCSKIKGSSKPADLLSI